MNHDFASLSSDQANPDVPMFVPVGSIEIHGPILPTGTDTFIAMAFAQKFAQKVGGLAFPPVFVGVCPNTNRFKGTVSVTHSGFITYIKDLCLSLIHQGIRKIILVNIHSGNDAALKIVVEEIFTKLSHPIYYFNPYIFKREQLDPLLFDGQDNSYKEAALLAASLQVLNHGEIRFGSTNDDEDHLISRPDEMNLLRKYGSVGFTYYEEAQHIAARKNVNLTAGLEYIERVTESIPELITSLSKHIERCASLDKGD